MRNTIRNSQGFTLLELAIVLIIIGFIVGGILFGRDMVEAAQMRKIATEHEQIETAIKTFQLKYNCIPGDCKEATAFFPGAYNGDGNGLIEQPNAAFSYEMTYFSPHLSAANLVPSVTNPYEYPAGITCNGTDVFMPGFNTIGSAYNPNVGWGARYLGPDDIAGGGGNNWLAASKGNNLFLSSSDNSTAPCDGHSNSAWWAYGANAYGGVFTCEEASRYDTKYDDGRASGGRIMMPGGNISSCWSSGNYNTAATTTKTPLIFSMK